jgi:hypothetical protein
VWPTVRYNRLRPAPTGRPSAKVRRRRPMHVAASATRAQPSLAGDPRRAGRAREGREAEGRGEGRAAREARRAQPLRKVVKSAASGGEPERADRCRLSRSPAPHCLCAPARPPASAYVARASCVLVYGKAALDWEGAGQPCGVLTGADARRAASASPRSSVRWSTWPAREQPSTRGLAGWRLRVLGPRGRYCRSTPLSSAAGRTETDGRRGHPAGRTGRTLLRRISPTRPNLQRRSVCAVDVH